MNWDAYGPDDRIDDQGADYLYEQLAGILAARIERGDWEPRRLIPSETHLCQEYAVARKTARRAIGLLVERGLVEVKPQRGVFVKPADNQDKSVG
jgi:DNA-binding GntR family transcriptional regulator